jgi:hypothetical protein
MEHIGQSQKNYQSFDRSNPKVPYIPIKKDIEWFGRDQQPTPPALRIHKHKNSH